MAEIIIFLLFGFFTLVTLFYILIIYPNFLRTRSHFVSNVDEAELLLEISKIKLVPKYCIQITTKGNEANTILNGLKQLQSIYQTLDRKIQTLLRVDILTELASDKNYFANHDFTYPLSVHVVPAEYTTKNGAMLKGRALQYMITKRFHENEVLDNLFIIHFDAESIVTRSNLITMLFSTLVQSDKRIFQGPIFYPNNWFKSGILSRQMESLRPWNCYECHSNTKRSFPYHLHGSNLIIRADVEHEVGWDYKPVEGYPVVAEDLFFGIFATFLLGRKIFGWHGAVMYEQPALTLLSSLKQRVRWIRGSLQALHVVPEWEVYRSLSILERTKFQFKMRSKLYVYGIGFIPAIITLVVFVTIVISFLYSGLVHTSISDRIDNYRSMTSELPSWIINFTTFGAFLWLLTIQIGLYHNISPLELKPHQRLIEHLKILLITPLATIFDTGCVVYTLIKWSVGNHKAQWDVTPKEISM